jgi:hypothetical protein
MFVNGVIAALFVLRVVACLYMFVVPYPAHQQRRDHVQADALAAVYDHLPL